MIVYNIMQYLSKVKYPGLNNFLNEQQDIISYRVVYASAALRHEQLIVQIGEVGI